MRYWADAGGIAGNIGTKTTKKLIQTACEITNKTGGGNLKLIIALIKCSAAAAAIGKK